MKSADYLPPQSPQYEELLEVVTRAFAKLNIDWPAEKQTQPHRGVKDRGRNHSWPTYSSTASDYYGNVAGLRLCGAEMSRVEQMLAGYLSPGAASSLKAPVLPSKPLCATSALVGTAPRYTVPVHGTRQRVRLVHVCRLRQCYKRTKPTCKNN